MRHALRVGKTSWLILGALVFAAACDSAGNRDGAAASAADSPVTVDVIHVSHLDDAPPPISGGTLTLSRDGNTAIAADPDRDAIYIVDLISQKVRTIELASHDEPGRVVLDRDEHKAYVALRSGGAVVTIDLDDATIFARTNVCPAPRGIVWDDAAQAVRVVCVGGEIVTVKDGVAATAHLDGVTDLRDVMINSAGQLFISTFRNANLHQIDLDVTNTNVTNSALDQLIDPPAPSGSITTRRVAWRTIITPIGGSVWGSVSEQAVMIAQSDPTKPVAPTQTDWYVTSLTASTASASVPTVAIGNTSFAVSTAVVPVDIAVSNDAIAIAAVGNTHLASAPQILFTSPSTPTIQVPGPRLPGEITSVAFRPNGTVVAFSREPARLFLMSNNSSHTLTAQIDIPSTVSKFDTGHAIFHANSGVGIACASCHPEGRDDGHVWSTTDLGFRRTQCLVGTVKNTAPYHWGGEAADMRALATLTFTSRMLGPVLDDERVATLEQWLTALAPLPPSTPIDPAAVTRGAALFTSPAANCTSCHSGEMRTNNQSVDVRTGGAFQVPSLIGVGHRAPYFHDGSHASLPLVLATGHNGTALSSEQITDLVAFLQTL